MFRAHTTQKQFKRSLLAASIMAIGSAQLAFADEPEPIEEMLVIGVKGAQQSAIHLKRDAATIVDGIAAEDIGKLPDTTITDSLQRITGVQIQRSAGEGGAISIRGMSQVALLLNGEQYLDAGNIAAAQPDLNNVPAQLLHGSQVYKSLDVRNAQSGITGTINIQTYRPLDFQEGFSAAGGIEGSYGELTKKTDPTFNGLINWRTEKAGVLLSAVTGTKNLANDFTGSAALQNPVVHTDANGVNRLAETTGFEAFSQGVERNRDGYNAAIQIDLDYGFQLVAEAFYTHAKSYDRRLGLNISNRWTGDDNAPNETPTHISHQLADAHGNPWVTVDQYDIRALWVKSYTIDNVDSSNSKNFNVELNYDNGGAFTGSLRAINANASALKYEANAEGDFSNWQGDNTFQLNTFYPSYIAKNYTADARHTEVGVAGGYYVNANPLGYGEDPRLTLARKNYTMTWGGFDRPIEGGLGTGKTLADYLANKYSQTIAGYSMDSNSDDHSGLHSVSAKGKYTFENDIFTDVEIGLRKSKRDVSVQVFAMFAPFYVGSSNFTTSPTNPSMNVAGCMAQWKSIDQQFQGGDDGSHSQCSAGERLVGSENDPNSFTAYTVNRPTKLDENGAKLKFVTNLGSHVKGIPGFYAVDPHTFDNPIAFQNKAFGSATRVINPSNSYDITLDELSSYVSANFTTGIVSGNLGARIIQSTLQSIANTTSGVTLANGDTTIANGKETKEKTNTEILPAISLTAAVTDELKLRFAAAKTKQELDLNWYGSSLGIDTTADPTNPGIRIPLKWNSLGNPNLKPWLATNYDFSAEYYVGQASLFSAGLYYIQIDSFVDILNYDKDLTVNGKVYKNLPGQGPVQGKGGKVQGIELAAKFAFSDFTSGFLRDYGVDANYTYSPSEKKIQSHTDISGKYYPFADNSKNTYNLVGWYQKDKLQARIALNYRSDRYISDSGEYGFSVYELGAAYIDANVSYDIRDNVTVYLEGSNITSTDTKWAYRLKAGVEQDGNYWDNEARYSLGLRAKF